MCTASTKQQCQTVSDTKCSVSYSPNCQQVSEQKCATGNPLVLSDLRTELINVAVTDTVNEQDCSGSAEEKCSTVQERVCTNENDQQCNTVTDR